MLTRRGLPCLFAPFFAPARAQASMPPVLLVHGNGDHAALWLTTLWRFAVNGHEQARAISLPDPLARGHDATPQPHRSSSAEQTERLAAEVARLRAETGAARVALVGSSRGGYPIRDFIVHQGGAAQVSHAITCGTPNRGVYDWEASPGGEFNGRGPFLRRLNGGTGDVVDGTEFLTLRSDALDLFAQPDGRFVGRPGVPTGITAEGPELRGATNLVLPGLDHREVAFHPRAFAEIFRFIAGRDAQRLDIPAQPRPVLNGQVTGSEAGSPGIPPAWQPTNRPVAGVRIAVWRIGEDGGRVARLHEVVTDAGGVWGPMPVAPDWRLEWEVAFPGRPTLHLFAGPFPRDTDVFHIRPPLPLTAAEQAAGAAAGGAVRLTRPRGYIGAPRDLVLIDGQRPGGIPEGVPRITTVAATLPAARLGTGILGVSNTETVVGHAVPASENRVAVLEMLH
ncbi:MAG: hydrolase [Rubritepida sp.]|nr:hydrolase [Rubritepida sp.]